MAVFTPKLQTFKKNCNLGVKTPFYPGSKAEFFGSKVVWF
jgi:hypothetical protein